MNPIEMNIRSRVGAAPVQLCRPHNERVRLWLVDDQEPVRGLLSELLEKFDSIQCEQQFSSAEALLEELRSHDAPDVILMDVQMPGMGGLDAIQKVSAVAPLTQVIMMTTFYDGERAALARKNGAFAFLVKTAPIESVVQHICAAASAPRLAPATVAAPKP
jgi:DNA-binding NarL/FixJ family response regulator